MWYFAWVLGVVLAALAAILNGMWLEMHLRDRADDAAPPQDRIRPLRQ